MKLYSYVSAINEKSYDILNTNNAWDRLNAKLKL